MKLLVPLVVLAASACDGESQDNTVARALAAEAVLPAQVPKSQPPKVVPMPKDQLELDRMILAGYTPHGKHLHPPGVKECPLSQGSEAVM